MGSWILIRWCNIHPVVQLVGWKADAKVDASQPIIID